MTKCLLCQSKDLVLDAVFRVDEIVRQWQSSFQINISPELKGCATVSLSRCRSCGLRSFDPALAGSGEMYAQLQRFDWYYLSQKWEHDVAIQDMRLGARILEIGCGRGDFLARTKHEIQADCMGIELNPKALNEARGRGLSVCAQSLDEIRSRRAGEFEVVCGFQVLEHVPGPHDFITICMDLLKPGGRLLLSVPNDDGFLRFARSEPLNQPPHHVSRWPSTTLERIPDYFPVHLERLLCEPLALYHLGWYVDIQFNRLPYLPLVSSIGYRIAKYFVEPLIRATGMYKTLKGHSLYACYRKIV
jgi:SAM-dependent methyltransferase